MIQISQEYAQALSNKEENTECLAKLKEVVRQIDLMDGVEDGMVDGKEVTIKTQETQEEAVSVECCGIPYYV